MKECRPWFPTRLPDNLDSLLSTQNSLRVMSYNLLAESLVEAVEYGNLNPEFLAWQNRKKQI